MKDEAFSAILGLRSARFSLCDARRELSKLGAAQEAEAIALLEGRCEQLCRDIEEKTK